MLIIIFIKNTVFSERMKISWFKTNKGICKCKLEAFNRSLKPKIVSDSSNNGSDLFDEIIPDINIGVDITEKELLKGFTDFIVGDIIEL